MHDENPGSAATAANSPVTVKGYAQRLQAQVEQWKTDGCPYKTKDVEGHVKACGAAPHGVRQGKPTDDGKVTIYATCTEGHEDVWEFMVDVAEIKAEAARNQAAAEEAQRLAGDLGEGVKLGKNPLYAELYIRLNVHTQEFSMTPFIPTPGCGLMMLELARKSIYDQMDTSEKRRKDGLVVPDKKLLGPGGRPLN